jgi:drug/metabolite transporter (DMT)-like permease
MKQLIKSTPFLAIVACLLWSTAFVGVKTGLQYMTPFQFAGLRFFIAGLLILPFYGNFKSYLAQVKENIRFVLLIAFIQTFLIYSFFYSGMNLVPASVGAMIIGCYPLFAALVAHFMMPDDKMNLRSASGFFVGIIGIVIINYGRQVVGLAGSKELLGVLFLILNNITGGFSNVAISKSKSNISPVVLSSSSLTIGGLMLIICSIPLEGVKIQHYPPVFYLSLAWLSFLSAAAFSIWFLLLKRPGVKVSYLNSWKFILPVVGAILSWSLLPDESPEIFSIIGMIFVVASLLIMNPSVFKASRVKD